MKATLLQMHASYRRGLIIFAIAFSVSIGDPIGGSIAAEITIVDQACASAQAKACVEKATCVRMGAFGKCSEHTAEITQLSAAWSYCTAKGAADCPMKIDVPTSAEIKALFDKMEASQQAKWVQWLELLEKSDMIKGGAK